MLLQGKVAAITGAAQGIGRAIALRFADEGASLALCDLNLQDLERLVEVLPTASPAHRVYRLDVTDSKQVNAVVQAIIQSSGRIDILVNNAGLTYRTPLLDIPEPEWDHTYAVHVKGPFLLTQAIGRHMVGRGQGGRIINIASNSGQIAQPNKAHYCSSKAALIHFSRCAAVELGPFGINVNAVCPGPTDTDPIASRAAEDRDYIRRHNIVLGRLARKQDVANAVLFLASPASDHITGHALYVDGGEVVR
jgi:NAD(P)-dependent dehydrogenase (short-subunit alcohol dehydrogenase family)